jgi:hypothetical protein
MSGFNGWAGYNESVSAVTATPSVELGSRQFSDSREYVYMYNGGAVAYPARVVQVSGVTGYTFVVTFASGAGVHAQPFGVVRNATIAAGSYGWVLTRGFTDLKNDGTAVVSVGDLVVNSLDGLVRVTTATSVVTQTVYGGIVGKAMQATDTCALFGAYVRLG